MPDLDAIVGAAADAAGIALDATGARAVGGGCINVAWRVPGPDGAVFLKANRASDRAMFEAEAAGLRSLREAHALRVPEVLAVGLDAGSAWLLLEWIEPGRADRRTEVALGRGLAAQHRVSADAFGWVRDNWIGATPQENAQGADWPAFFAIHRLGFQVDLLETTGSAGRLIGPARRLIESVPALLAGHAPVPALLHGDLWGGNWAADASGAPWLFDPAVYFGDREADLAMTRLFGGFGPDFYAAYEEAWPLPAGAGLRADLYNLYHVLNHVNLFGAGYLAQAARLIERLLAAGRG